MKKVFIITFCVLLSEILVSKDISKIKLVYGAEGTHLMVAASCTPESFDSNFGDEMNFLITYDELFIEQFNSLYKKLLPTDDSIKRIDPRVMAIITYDKHVTNDTVYFGETYGIYRNDTILKDNECLLNIIKRKIGWINSYKKK